MPVDYSKLKGKIIEKYGTRKAFAKAINKSEIIVCKKLNNKSRFSQKSINEWAEALNIERKDYGDYFFTPKV